MCLNFTHISDTHSWDLIRSLHSFTYIIAFYFINQILHTAQEVPHELCDLSSATEHQPRGSFCTFLTFHVMTSWPRVKDRPHGSQNYICSLGTYAGKGSKIVCISPYWKSCKRGDSLLFICSLKISRTFQMARIGLSKGE